VILGLVILMGWLWSKLADSHPFIALFLALMFVWFLIGLAIFLPANHASAAEIRGATVYAQSNQVRANQKLKPLGVSPILVKAAQAKADDMVKNKYFAHRSPQGKNFWDFILAQHAYFRVAGENLAEGFTDTESLFSAWIASPKHYANIIDNSYSYTGIGIAHAGETTYVVQLFSTK